MTSVPRAFLPYAAVVVAGAAAIAVAARIAAGPALPGDAELWLLAAFVVLGELMPIHVPRRAGNDWLTVSSAFGLAVLLAYGLWPAIAIYAVASLAGDLAFRTRPVVAVFNAGQYVLSLAAAAGTLALLGEPAPVGSIVDAGPVVLAGLAAFFAVNELVAGAGSAVLAGQPVGAYLRRDIGFQLWTGGFQLALAPIVVALADAGAWLVPLAFCPLVAVWVGGRQAALNDYRAVHDPLTDLPNRGALRDALAELGGAVLVLDVALPDLPVIRRTLGHELADDLLAAVAGRVRGALREGELIGRLDADELGIVSKQTPEAAVDRLLGALDEAFEVDGLELEVHAVAGAALGAATSPAGADALLTRAALALAAAREGGRRWVAHEPDQEVHSRHRLALATQLRRGLQRGELSVDYQLKVPLGGDRPYGVEALVRWEHPDLGRVGPDGFIALAERSGLIAQLTDHVLATALHDARTWLDRGLDVRVAVNLSTVLLCDERLPERLSRHLAAAGVPASSLQLEITESRLMGARGHGVLDELCARGLALSIDDFGVGFSSLAQLRTLPVSELKIDKAFVLGMATDAGDAAVVRAAIGLGRDLDLAVVAEGVEDAATARRLGELGCHYAQGYHFGHPTAAADCERRLRALTGADVVPLEAAS